MNIIGTSLKGVFIIEPDVYCDHRGYFMESYNKRNYLEHKIHSEFVQDNISYSTKNILRGLHYQLKQPQAKLVQVLLGEVFDVIVDVRIGSPQFGQWVGVVLSENNRKQCYISEGFAHGFCVMSDHALFHYKCSDYYAPKDEYGVLWNDSAIGISWPISEPILSDKDRQYTALEKIPRESLPLYIR